MFKCSNSHLVIIFSFFSYLYLKYHKALITSNVNICTRYNGVLTANKAAFDTSF
jgi:hypothetical protein